VLILLSAAPAFAGVMKLELPPETGSFKPAPGAELANGQCLVCHSVEYVTSQPPFPRAFWAASVKKMREKFGAAVPADQVDPLVNYLATTYGTDTNATSASAATMASSVSGAGAEALATKYGCLGCHNVALKVVGPPYREVAAKYQNDPQAFAKIAEQIHRGGSGKWGPVIMPPFPMITDAETKTLADWILGQK